MNKYKFDKEYNQKILQDKKIAIVVGYFYQDIAEKLLIGAIDALKKYGINERNIDIFYVPGAFEIPFMCQEIANKFDGIITLGVVIKGETPHFDYVCNQCANGILKISLEKKIPISFGVLTTNNMAQTLDRAGGEKGNKGYEATIAMVEMLYLIQTQQINYGNLL